MTKLVKYSDLEKMTSGQLTSLREEYEAHIIAVQDDYYAAAIKATAEERRVLHWIKMVFQRRVYDDTRRESEESSQEGSS